MVVVILFDALPEPLDPIRILAQSVPVVGILSQQLDVNDGLSTNSHF